MHVTMYIRESKEKEKNVVSLNVCQDDSLFLAPLSCLLRVLMWSSHLTDGARDLMLTVQLLRAALADDAPGVNREYREKEMILHEREKRASRLLYARLTWPSFPQSLAPRDKNKIANNSQTLSELSRGIFDASRRAVGGYLLRGFCGSIYARWKRPEMSVWPEDTRRVYTLV